MDQDDLEERLVYVPRPSWSTKFNVIRSFDRASENQAYVNFIRQPLDHEDSDQESGGCWLRSEESSRESEIEDEVDVTRDGIDYEITSEDEDVEVTKDNIVELFMNGLESQETLLEYPDQVETVVKFCTRAKLEDLSQTNIGTGAVSLLYDSNSSIGNLQRRPRRLTPCELYKRLLEERYTLKLDKTNTVTIGKYRSRDAERRLLFSVNPNCWVILAIAATAPRSQARALKDFFYKYLRARTSLGVTVSSHEPKTFTFNLHLSYFSFHRSRSSQGSCDPADGAPSRKITALPSYNAYDKPLTSKRENPCDVEYMQEAQISLCLTGIDHRNWTVYEFVDASHYSRDSLNRVYDPRRPDPTVLGLLPTSDPIYENPREFFLKVFEIRIRLILREWRQAELWAINELEQVPLLPFPPLVGSSNDKLIRDTSEWVNEMGKTLRELRNKLSETIRAWHAFNRHGLGFFLAEDGIPTSSSCLKESIVAIDECFSDLRAVLSSLDAQAHNVDEIRVSVSSHLSLENRSATVFQQRTPCHTKVLTLMSICLLTTQGYLLFRPTLSSFIHAFIFVTSIVGTTAALLFDWDRCHLLGGVVWNKLKFSIPIWLRLRRDSKAHIDGPEDQSKVYPERGTATSLQRRRPLINRMILRRQRPEDVEMNMMSVDLESSQSSSNWKPHPPSPASRAKLCRDSLSP